MINVQPLRAVLINAQSADETTSQGMMVRAYTNLTMYLIGAGTITSGVLTIEESTDDPDTEQTYGGTWSTITTINAANVTGGLCQAYHFTPACYSVVRARISTAIGGSNQTLTVVLVAN